MLRDFPFSPLSVLPRGRIYLPRPDPSSSFSYKLMQHLVSLAKEHTSTVLFSAYTGINRYINTGFSANGKVGIIMEKRIVIIVNCGAQAKGIMRRKHTRAHTQNEHTHTLRHKYMYECMHNLIHMHI